MPHRRGQAHPRARLSDDDVRLMRELRKKYGMPYRLIAEKFDVSLWTVRDIVTNTTRAL